MTTNLHAEAANILQRQIEAERMNLSVPASELPLLAAASDMLNALREARKWINGQPDRSMCTAETLSDMLDMIDAAISKAEGRKP